MAWTYRRRVKILPGFYLNLSRNGISSTIGIRGLNVNFGKSGTYLNQSIPGTGLRNRQRIDSPTPRTSTPVSPPPDEQEQARDDFHSGPAEGMTSATLSSIREAMLTAREEKENLRNELGLAERECRKRKVIRILSRVFVWGSFSKEPDTQLQISKENLAEVKKEFSDYKFQLDFHLDKETTERFHKLEKAFEEFRGMEYIWNVDSQRSVNRVAERSSASASITRSAVEADQVSFEYVDLPDPPMRLYTSTGASLVFLPGFLIFDDTEKSSFALIDYHDLQRTAIELRFVESSDVPRDSIKVGTTWAKVNKDGSRDERFAENPEYPIMKYLEVDLVDDKGLQEKFIFSNYKAAFEFFKLLHDYIGNLSRLEEDIV